MAPTLIPCFSSACICVICGEPYDPQMTQIHADIEKINRDKKVIPVKRRRCPQPSFSSCLVLVLVVVIALKTPRFLHSLNHGTSVFYASSLGISCCLLSRTLRDWFEFVIAWPTPMPCFSSACICVICGEPYDPQMTQIHADIEKINGGKRVFPIKRGRCPQPSFSSCLVLVVVVVIALKTPSFLHSLNHGTSVFYASSLGISCCLLSRTLRD